MQYLNLDMHDITQCHVNKKFLGYKTHTMKYPMKVPQAGVTFV